ncbi:MAG: FAD-binding oxidoreductase [Deltaproteobacteria bacterium]|nr:FAD-binding oxidoreductase [Deltaproteobacteria bacterium]
MPIKEELEKLIDEVQIVDDPELLAATIHNNSFIKGGMPECLVRPKNSDEIQKLIEWASGRGIPLTPISSGGPHLRGGSAPLFGGVVMDLGLMDKIIAVDRNYRMAMVEPGVTFYQLKPELDKVGLRLPMPLSPRKSKSVMGSVLEREPITVPKYHIDMSAPLLCSEVVFGTGDIFRTGEASGPGTVKEQIKATRKQKWDSGPGQISFIRLLQAAQGSLGVVTWSTLRCEILPTIREFLFISGENTNEFIDFVYRILRLKLGDECFILNSLNVASLMVDGLDIKAIQQNLPSWLLVLGISGYENFPEERIAYQKNDLLNHARQLGLAAKSTIPGGKTEAFIRNLEEPTEPYWKFRLKGGCSDIFFLTTLDKVSKFVGLMYQLCNDHRYDVGDLGVYIQPIQQGRNCHCEFNLTYDPEDLKETEKVRRLFSAASEVFMKEGGFFSRPYGTWAQMAFNKDAASREAVRKLKSIFDPKNIMNPGKLC